VGFLGLRVLMASSPPAFLLLTAHLKCSVAACIALTRKDLPQGRQCTEAA
jgi:hypothetical protein